jgi:hypothetical protein
MTHQILVPFRGEGAGVGELTWAQRGIWRSIQRQGSSEYLGGTSVLPAGTTVQNLVVALRFVMSRHQALRTRLTFGEDGDARQRLFAEGELPLEVVDAGADDPAAVAEVVRIRYQSTDFDYAGEWPVRTAAICVDGVPTHTVAVYSHLVIDAHGLTALMTDLATMDPATGEPTVPMTAIQPLAQARQQSTPAARRQTEGAVRHWARVLRTATPQRFGESTDPREPRYWGMSYHSPASDRAMRAIAARDGTDTSPVLLAAYAVALARTVSTNPIVLQIAVSNRFRPGCAESVSALAQASPCLIDIADVTFDQAVGRAYQAAMATYLNAYYDPLRRVAMVAQVQEERGERIDLECYFNDRRDPDRTRDATVPTMAEIVAALPASTLSWGPHTSVPQPKLYLNVDDAPDGVEFTMIADTRHIAPADMSAIVRTVEAVVVEAAADGTTPTGVSCAAPSERAPSAHTPSEQASV